LKAAGAFDGHVSNGGLGHALDVTGENDVEEAVQGLRYFGLQGAARVVVTAMTLEDEGAQEELSRRYYAAAGDLQVLFERHYEEHPDEFDPPPEL